MWDGIDFRRFWLHTNMLITRSSVEIFRQIGYIGRCEYLLQELSVGSTDFFWLILIWGVPLIALQWLIGLDILIRHWKVWVLGIAVPTLYLTLAASIALGTPLWRVNLTQFTGSLIPIVNVPIELVLLFLVVNMLIVQGLIFALNGRQIVARVRGFAYLIRRGPAGIRELEEGKPPTTPPGKRDTQERKPK